MRNGRVDLVDLLRRLTLVDETVGREALMPAARESERLQACVSGRGSREAVLKLIGDLKTTKIDQHKLRSVYLKVNIQALIQAREALPAVSTSKTFRAAVDEAIFRTAADFGHEALYRIVEASDAQPDLPLVDELVTRYLTDSLDSLRRVVMVGCQHLLGTVNSQFAALERYFGLDPRNTFLIGKPYSSSGAVVRTLSDRGYTVDDGLTGFSRLRNLHSGAYVHDRRARMKRLIHAALTQARHIGAHRVLVVDDGGQLIQEVVRNYELEHSESPTQFLAVEQTSSGWHLASSASFGEKLPGRRKFNIVPAALASSKLVYESPLIAASVVDNLRDRLHMHNAELAGLRVCVVGYGSVGSWTAKQLKDRQCYVTVVDRNPHKLSIAAAAGHHVASRVQDVKGYDVVVGATGVKNGAGDVSSLSRFLCSASSNSVEFESLLSGSVNYSDIFSRVRGLGDDFRSAHDDLRLEDGRIIFNGGFPINFPGSVDPIVAHEIELTRAIMVAAIVQAVDPSIREGESSDRNRRVATLNDEIDQFLSAHAAGRR